MDGVVVELLRLDPGLAPPRYAREHDAGADLAIVTDLVLEPGRRALVGTGVAVALPPGYVGLIHPRSGLAARSGVTIVNAPGTVDAGYRGEIMVCLLNTDSAQPVVQRVEHAIFREVRELPPSERGDGGHGSSGGVRSWRSVDPGTDQG